MFHFVFRFYGELCFTSSERMWSHWRALHCHFFYFVTINEAKRKICELMRFRMNRRTNERISLFTCARLCTHPSFLALMRFAGIFHLLAILFLSTNQKVLRSSCSWIVCYHCSTAKAPFYLVSVERLFIIFRCKCLLLQRQMLNDAF